MSFFVKNTSDRAEKKEARQEAKQVCKELRSAVKASRNNDVQLLGKSSLGVPIKMEDDFSTNAFQYWQLIAHGAKKTLAKPGFGLAFYAHTKDLGKFIANASPEYIMRDYSAWVAETNMPLKVYAIALKRAINPQDVFAAQGEFREALPARVEDYIELSFGPSGLTIRSEGHLEVIQDENVIAEVRASLMASPLIGDTLEESLKVRVVGEEVVNAPAPAPRKTWKAVPRAESRQSFRQRRASYREARQSKKLDKQLDKLDLNAEVKIQMEVVRLTMKMDPEELRALAALCGDAPAQGALKLVDQENNLEDSAQHGVPPMQMQRPSPKLMMCRA